MNSKPPFRPFIMVIINGNSNGNQHLQWHWFAAYVYTTAKKVCVRHPFHTKCHFLSWIFKYFYWNWNYIYKKIGTALNNLKKWYFVWKNAVVSKLSMSVKFKILIFIFVQTIVCPVHILWDRCKKNSIKVAYKSIFLIFHLFLEIFNNKIKTNNCNSKTFVLS